MTALASRLRATWLWPVAIATVLLLLASCATPQHTQRQQTESAYSASLLWRIERSGGVQSYILGTLHAADPRLRDLRAEVQEALAASEIAVFELILTEEGTERAREAAVQLEGGRLEDVLGPELFARTAAVARIYGVSAHNLQRLTPFGLVAMLTYPMEEFYRIAIGHPILDAWLQQEARRQGKALQALETDDEQISLFTGMSAAEQSALVSDMLNDREAGVFEHMMDAYLAGDMGAIMAEVSDWSGAENPVAAEAFRERLIDDRNHRMVERLIPLLDRRLFVAVGAGHLPGEQGILRLLAQQGYTVTRVR